MTTSAQSFADLSDGHLLAAVHRLATDERRATVRLITSLVELDQRRLYLSEGYSSLFTYCTQVLHLSEHAAYRRIEAARVVRKYPVLLERLETGDLTLTTMRLLAPHLTSENYLQFVETAGTRASATSSIWLPRFDRSLPFRLSHGSCHHPSQSVRLRSCSHPPPNSR